MIVCHCHAVTDRELRKCLRDGAACVDSLGAMTGAGTCCGGCRDVIHEIVEEELGRAAGEPRSTEPALVTLRRSARAA